MNESEIAAMDLRDWFAGQCVSVVYADAPEDATFDKIAKRAYAVADSMLICRAGGELDEG